MARVRLTCIFVGILFVLIGAETVWAFSGRGSGTEGDPYIITTVDQLQEMQDDLTAWYELGNDIDATATRTWNDGEGFVPVGTWLKGVEYTFTGTFDGRGHSIENLYIDRIDGWWQGLFGCIWNATITNVHIIDANVTSDSKVGTLAGKILNESIVTYCSATGTVSLKPGTADSKSGGLIGSMSTASFVGRCFSGVNVNGDNRRQVGGIVGYMKGRNHYTILTDSYSYGTVTGKGAKQGNLVGDVDSSYINRCYSCGNTKALVGSNFMGSVVTNCYWDSDEGASSSSCGGTPKTTEEMIQRATFVDWDFIEIWNIDDKQTYPFLRIYW